MTESYNKPNVVKFCFLSKDFVLQIEKVKAIPATTYNVVLYRKGNQIAILSSKCCSLESANYWFSENHKVLRRLIVMADTLKDAMGTEDESFIKDWFLDLMKYWGSDGEVIIALKSAFSEYTGVKL